MTLIVEDGTGKSDAESFCSVAQADAYLEGCYGADTDWSSATETQKEQSLRQATNFLVGKYRGRWRGVQNKDTQALPWPRSNVLDEEGYYRANDSLPPELIHATCEAAKRIAAGTALEEDLQRGGHVQSVKVGPISQTFSNAATSQTRFLQIERMLSGLIEAGSGYRRVVRA